jgi:predicted Zn-dependent peptidase
MKGEKQSAAPLYLYPICTLKPIENHFVYYKKKGISSTIVNVGFRTCSYYSNDKYILQLLTHVLNGFSGTLFTAFRTKHGLTYHSSAHTHYHEHTGYMNFFIQTDPVKLLMDGKKEGILPILIGLITDLIQHGITEDDIKRAKGNCKGKVLMELQSIDSLASYNGINVVFQHQPGTFQNLYKTHIESITVKQVNDIIRKYMIHENLVVGIAYEKDIPKQTIEKLFSVI